MNNKLRNKIGLKVIEPNWTEEDLGSGEVICYISPENFIEKMVVFWTTKIGYYEVDLSIQLTEEGKIFSKSGKHKKVSYDRLSKRSPKFIAITITGNSILITNKKNGRVLMNEYDKRFLDVGEGFTFIEKYLRAKDTYIEEQIDNFKFAKKRSQKITHGDIFRVQIKDEKYIFGRVISKARKIIKINWPVKGSFSLDKSRINPFDPNPNFYPVWVQFYLKVFDKPIPDIEVFNTLTTSNSVVIPNDTLRTSVYEIIGNIEPSIDEFDVPMFLSTKYNFKPLFHYLSWGGGVVTFPIADVIQSFDNKLIELQKKYFWAPSLINKRIETFVISSINKKAELGVIFHINDLRDPLLKELKKNVFEALELDDSTNYDVFAEKYGFFTKHELINHFK